MEASILSGNAVPTSGQCPLIVEISCCGHHRPNMRFVRTSQALTYISAKESPDFSHISAKESPDFSKSIAHAKVILWSNNRCSTVKINQPNLGNVYCREKPLVAYGPFFHLGVFRKDDGSSSSGLCASRNLAHPSGEGQASTSRVFLVRKFCSV